jgi:hypothetical protein
MDHLVLHLPAVPAKPVSFPNPEMRNISAIRMRPTAAALAVNVFIGLDPWLRTPSQ